MPTHDIEPNPELGYFPKEVCLQVVHSTRGFCSLSLVNLLVPPVFHYYSLQLKRLFCGIIAPRTALCLFKLQVALCRVLNCNMASDRSGKLIPTDPPHSI